jgi:hypothetical protein
MSVTFTAVLHREGKLYVAYCPDAYADLVAQLHLADLLPRLLEKYRATPGR